MLLFQSNGTIPGQRFTKAEQTLIILSVIRVDASCDLLVLHIKQSIGRVPLKMVYFLRRRPMTRSPTWICTLAMPLVPFTCTWSSCSLPRVKAGIANCAYLNIRDSRMVNPRSARTRLPGNSLSSMPQLSVKYLSEVLPSQALETNEIVGYGVMLIKTLTVLWCL